MNDETTTGATPEGEGEETTPTVKPIAEMTKDELRARADELATERDALLDQPRTIETAKRIEAIKAERNEVVRAHNELVAFDATAADDEPVVEAPEPSATTEATPAEETTTTEGAAPAPEGTITEETTVSDTPDTPPADPAALAAAETVVAEAGGELAGTAVAASAARPTAPATPAKPAVAFVAGAGQHEFNQGQALDWQGLADALDSGRHLQPGPNGKAQAVVASIPSFASTPGLDVELLGRHNSTDRNTALIAERTEAHWAARAARLAGHEPEAHVAAICTPLDIIREIPRCGVTDMPFEAMFPGMPVGRGGFQFTRGSSIAETDDAITLIDDVAAWEAAFDESDVDTWKPCVNIECAVPTQVIAEELVTCVTVHTSVEMSSPERVQEFMHKVEVQRARRREQIQLDKFDATAHPFTYTGKSGYGALPTLVAAVENVLPVLAYTERLDETDWDVAIEPGHINFLTIDRHNACSPAEMPGARAETLAWLRNQLGLPITVLRDFEDDSPFQALPTVGAAAVELEDLPTTWRLRLVPTGAYIYGSTGEESTGWQTDPQLARQNRRQLFTQEWFLFAKHGCHPAATIDIASFPDGGRGGCVEPYGVELGGS